LLFEIPLGEFNIKLKNIFYSKTKRSLRKPILHFFGAKVLTFINSNYLYIKVSPELTVKLLFVSASPCSAGVLVVLTFNFGVGLFLGRKEESSCF
jgi:hypothetical protein